MEHQDQNDGRVIPWDVTERLNKVNKSVSQNFDKIRESAGKDVEETTYWKTLVIWILVPIGLIALCFLGHEIATIIADAANHIMHIFDRATLNPRDSRGFASAVQLIMIAVFVGWAIRRLMNKFGK